jgi:hypothetical protein
MQEGRIMRLGLLLAGSLVALGVVACSQDGSVVPNTGRLEAPPPGQGVQITTGDFDVAPSTEEQDCYFFKVRDLAAAGGMNPDEPIYLHRTQIAYKSGSHHMNLFRVRTILGLDPANGPIQRSVNGASACSKSVNWADWPLIANSQNDGSFDWTYPDGVANKLDPDETIMMQTHYVNATTQKTAQGGHVDVNLWSMPADQVKQQMGTLFATKQSIRICASNPTPTFEGTCQINSGEGVQVIGANGHFHSRGKEFQMFNWDGKTIATPPMSDKFYTSEQWNEPPMMRSPELDENIPVHGGVWYTCSYQWVPPPPEVGCDLLNQLDKTLYNTPDDKLDCCYTFGNTVDRAEHCNVFVYYYPKQDDVNCF